MAAAQAYCDWAVRCRHVPDHATCRRLLDPKEWDIRRALDAYFAGRLGYDPLEAARCLEATREAACLAEPFSHPACRRAFWGLVPQGGTCVAAYECQGGGACLHTSCDEQCCLGVCGPPRQPEPEPELRGVGEPCERHSDCEPMAYCERNRVCTPLPDEEGEHCLFGCAWGDLYCDVATETCRAYVPLGGACDGDARRCDAAYAFCGDGVCRPIPGAGEPCGPDPNQPCVPTAFCDEATSTCVARRRPGEPCTRDAECDLACHLATGTCAEYRNCLGTAFASFVSWGILPQRAQPRASAAGTRAR